MNVFEFAKKMELDGIQFYLDEAARTSQSGFKKILQMLADEEKKHYMFLDALEQSFEIQSMPPFPAAKVENIFQQMREHKEGFNFTADQVKIYEKALEIERKSKKFYMQEAEKITDEKLKKQILMIAEEEGKHVRLMGELVAYINRPNEWVEHAMFSQIREEY